MATITPNMSLTLPTPGSEPGPAYGTDQNASFTRVDSHNHTSGQGVAIPAGGLNINSDLPFGGFNATLLRSTRFVSQSSVLSAGTDLACVYVSGGNLYYNNSGGTAVQITSGSSVNAGAGSITGLPSGTASVSFASSTYFFRSATSTPATIDVGSVIVRNTTSSGHGVTLSPINALAADYSLTLPSIPAQTNVMTLDTSGNMGSTTYDAVGQAMTSVGANAIANTRTRTTGTTVAAGGVASSSSSGTFTTTSTSAVQVTNLSVTITTNGRPVFVGIQGDDSASATVVGSNNSNFSWTLELRNGATIINGFRAQGTVTGGATPGLSIPPGAVWALDFPAAGTYTYHVFASVANSAATLTVGNASLVAYEL